jgi:hypothetical protein
VVLADDRPAATTPLERLIDALLARAQRLADRAVAEFQEAFPSYAELDPAELAPVVLRNTISLLESVRDPGRDTAADRVFYRESGEHRARMGITSDEMLHAWRIGLKVTRTEAYTLARELDIGEDVVLGFV